MSSNLKVNTILPSTGTAIGIGTASGNVDVLGHIVGHNTPNISGINSVTATTFYGSGANLTSLPAQATIANNADNRVITGGSGVNLNGESNLTFNGSLLNVSARIACDVNSDIDMSNSADGQLVIGGDGYTSAIALNNVGMQIYHNSASRSIIFGTNETERLRIDSSGRLLIGTTTATGAAKLQLLQSSGDGLLVRNHDTNYEGIILSNASGEARLMATSGGSTARPALTFFAGDAERFRITSDGKIGINVTAPATTLHLDSTGTPTTIQIDSDTESSIDFNDHGGSAKRYKIGTNITDNSGQFEIKDMTANAERLRIQNDGIVNIGVASPQYAKKVNIQGGNGETLSLSNQDYTGHAAGSMSGIEGRLQCGGGQWSSSGVRFKKENGTSGDKHTRLELYATDGYANKTGLIVHPDGEVTKPIQPMCCYNVSNTSAGNYMSHYSVLTNVGSNYNTGNGRFTCPVGGNYFCTVMVMSDNSNTTMDLELHKNGVNPNNILVPYSAATGGQYNQAVGSCIIGCSAGDYLQFKLNSGSVYAGRHSSISFCLLS